MTDTMIERYRRWFEYEKDAHEKTLASLARVPDADRSSPAFQKAVELFAHIFKARRLWLHRFGAAQEDVRDLFARDVAFAALASFAEETQTMWSAFFESLDGAAIAGEFEYQSLDAGRFRNSIEDILTQLFGHSWYHRGQIAALVKSAGGTPAVTDFVFWCRVPIDASEGSISPE
jgi:uncharacterized damage-inducible protein DinB